MTAWVPKPYQLKAVRHLLERCAGALFLDPGLGKTSVCLAAISELKAQKMFRCALVIAPLRVCHNVWPDEANKWDDFKGLSVTVLHGNRKLENLATKSDIYLINPEGLEWFLGVDSMTKLKPDVLIVDESTKFKHTNTRRFKLLKPELGSFGRRWILTGSPAPNGLLDLFGQVFIADRGAGLGRYITHYREMYFYPSGYGGYDWLPQKDAPEKIYERLAPLALRMSSQDYLDLPELVKVEHPVALPPPARKIYTELETVLLSRLASGEVLTAASVADSVGKCRQVANGGIYHQADEGWDNLHTAKVDAVVDLVEECSGQPTIVAYEFRHDLDRLLKAFGKDTPYIGGGVSTGKSKAIIEAWNKGDIPVLLGHPGAMGHGLNLQGAGSHVIWHSIPWDLEAYDQLIARLWRQGNERSHVFVHHVIAKDTLDEVVMKRLRTKDTVQTNLLKALSNYAKEREKK